MYLTAILTAASGKLKFHNSVTKYFVIPHGIGSSGDLIGAVTFDGVNAFAIAFLDETDMVARPVSVPVDEDQATRRWPEVSSLPLVM